MQAGPFPFAVGWQWSLLRLTHRKGRAGESRGEQGRAGQRRTRPACNHNWGQRGQKRAENGRKRKAAWRCQYAARGRHDRVWNWEGALDADRTTCSSAWACGCLPLYRQCLAPCRCPRTGLSVGPQIDVVAQQGCLQGKMTVWALNDNIKSNERVSFDIVKKGDSIDRLKVLCCRCSIYAGMRGRKAYSSK